MPMVWDANARNILLWTALHHQTTSPREIQKHWPHGGVERPSPRAVTEQWASIKKGCYNRGAVAFFTGNGRNASRRAPPRQQPAPARRNRQARARSTSTQAALGQVATSSDKARRAARTRKRPAPLSQVVLEISSDESDKECGKDPKRCKADVHDIDRIADDRNNRGPREGSRRSSLQENVAKASVRDQDAMLTNGLEGTLVSGSVPEAIVLSEADESEGEGRSHAFGDGSCPRTTRHKRLCQRCQARKFATPTRERGELNGPQSSEGSLSFTFGGVQQGSDPHDLQTHRRFSSKFGNSGSQVLSADKEESSEERIAFAKGGPDRHGKRPMDHYMTAMESPEACSSDKIISRDLVVNGSDHIASARVLEDKLAILPRMPTGRDSARLPIMFGRNLPSDPPSLIDEVFEKEKLEPWGLEIYRYLCKEGPPIGNT